MRGASGAPVGGWRSFAGMVTFARRSAPRVVRCVGGLGFVLLIGACGADRPGDGAAAPPAEVAPPAPSPAEPAPLEAPLRHFAQVPDSVLRRDGACPFECCVYGDWRADSTIVLLAGPQPTAPAVDTLRSDQRFQARSGFVDITGPAIIAVLDEVRTDAGELLFAPGDTLVVLDYVGEGVFNLWHQGRVFEEVPGFWGAEMDSPKGAYYGDYQREWWVEAVGPSNRAGWFRADTPGRFSGADACAGPL